MYDPPHSWAAIFPSSGPARKNNGRMTIGRRSRTNPLHHPRLAPDRRPGARKQACYRQFSFCRWPGTTPPRRVMAGRGPKVSTYGPAPAMARGQGIRGLRAKREPPQAYSAARAWRAFCRSISACTAALDWPVNSAWCALAIGVAFPPPFARPLEMRVDVARHQFVVPLASPSQSAQLCASSMIAPNPPEPFCSRSMKAIASSGVPMQAEPLSMK